MAPSNARVLIVDDELPLMQALCDTLESKGFEVSGFTSAGQALAVLREQSFDIVLTDLMMPEMDGIVLLGKAFEIDPDLAGIVMTGHGSVNTAVDALKTGAVDYILKPFKLSSVMPVLTRALSARRLRLENIQLREAAALHEVSLSIASARDSSEVMEKVADAAFAQSKARGLRVLLAVPGEEELHVAAVRGTAMLTAEPIRLDQALEAWAARWGDAASDLRTDLRVPDDCAQCARLHIPMVTGGKLIGILQFDTDDSARIPTLGHIKALHILAGAAASALSAASLVERLSAAEQRYRNLTENAPDIVSRYELHPWPGFVYVNPAVTALTGYTPEEHYADPEFTLKMTHPEDRALAERALRGEYPSGSAITLRWMSSKGVTLWIEQRNALICDAAGRLTAIESISRDITERKNLEERLRHTQKLEAIGRLTAGVAHDFNNLLTIINGYSALALQAVDASDPIWNQISEVKKAGDQAAGLTSQLLAFSRTQILQPRAVNLAAVLAEMDQMIRKSAGEDVQVTMNFPSGLGCVRIDPGQVQQMVLNLAVNARDAMPQGGTLSLQLANVTVPETGLETTGVPAGDFTKLTVSDNGSGMTAEVKQRVFEPFFTTKQMGRGTGLGLATVYGIVEQSGGYVRLDSEPGVGTTFTIYFPRCADPEDAAPVAGLPVARGTETILVVEDMPSVRSLVKGILSQAGYTVLTAEDGYAAIQEAQSHEGPIQLLLTDMRLSKMAGPEVAERVRAIRPDIRVLFMTGYSEAANKHAGDLAILNLIRKPFSSYDLCNRVRKTLTSPLERKLRILVVDDEEPIRYLLKEILERAGFVVETAGNGKEAIKRVSNQAFDVVITDLVMPEVEGIELISHLRRDNPKLKLVAMSGAFFPEVLRAARLLGACGTLSKPLSAENVVACIRGL